MSLRRRVFAALYDQIGKGSEDAGMRDKRHRLLAHAAGTTIEIGAGTGLNLAHYPDAVTRLVLTEPDRHMRLRLQQRVDSAARTAEIVDAPVERLPFQDATFDTAVVTFVLCSVPDQQAALAETSRVLRRDGHLLFLEHVRSADAKVAKTQDRVAPLYRFLAGCNPNRDTLAAIQASPLTIAAVEHGEVPKAPAFERPLIVGTAHRSA